MSKTDKTQNPKIKSEQISKQEIKTTQNTKSEIRTEQTQDYFTVCKQNIEKYFESLEKAIPKYYQTINELQQEYLHTYENMINATLSIQKEYAGKAGVNSKQSEAASKIVSDTTEAAIKARTIRDEIVLTSIDTLKDNIKEWNNRSQSFVDLNKKIAQAWISSCSPSKN